MKKILQRRPRSRVDLTERYLASNKGGGDIALSVMKKLTKHQKKFWDYLKRESGIVEHRITGNFESVIKKMLDGSNTKVICDGRHRIDVFNTNSKEQQC